MISPIPPYSDEIKRRYKNSKSDSTENCYYTREELYRVFHFNVDCGIYCEKYIKCEYIEYAIKIGVSDLKHETPMATCKVLLSLDKLNLIRSTYIEWFNLELITSVQKHGHNILNIFGENE